MSKDDLDRPRRIFQFREPLEAPFLDFFFLRVERRTGNHHPDGFFFEEEVLVSVVLGFRVNRFLDLFRLEEAALPIVPKEFRELDGDGGGPPQGRAALA